MPQAAKKRKRPDLAALNKLRTTHGHSGKTTNNIWRSMIARCFNNKRKDFEKYGGRGISVCDRWKKFENFLEDMGERPAGMQLDRKNNDEGYSKENCRWVTASQNSSNRRSSRFVDSKNITQFSKELGTSHQLVNYRLKSGWSVDEIKNNRRENATHNEK